MHVPIYGWIYVQSKGDSDTSVVIALISRLDGAVALEIRAESIQVRVAWVSGINRSRFDQLCTASLITPPSSTQARALDVAIVLCQSTGASAPGAFPSVDSPARQEADARALAVAETHRKAQKYIQLFLPR